MNYLALAALLVSTELAPGVILIPGQLSRDRSPDGNSVLLRGSEGWVLIDSGRGGEHTDEVIDFLADSKAPLRAVLNTHWHLDHIGGNPELRQKWPEAPIYAHPAIDRALAGFHAESRAELEKILPTIENPPLKARLETELALLRLDRALAADKGIAESGASTFAGRPLDLHVETRAVSDGDIWVFDPESKILIAGDLVTLPVPLFDTACPEGWREALSRVAEVEFETLVPGHGSPLSRESFESYRRRFDSLLVCASREAESSVCIDDWFRSVAAEDSPYARELLAYYQKEFLGPDAPGRKRWCGEPR